MRQNLPQSSCLLDQVISTSSTNKKTVNKIKRKELRGDKSYLPNSCTEISWLKTFQNRYLDSKLNNRNLLTKTISHLEPIKSMIWTIIHPLALPVTDNHPKKGKQEWMISLGIWRNSSTNVFPKHTSRDMLMP